jgi:hypothetical protein
MRGVGLGCSRSAHVAGNQSRGDGFEEVGFCGGQILERLPRHRSGRSGRLRRERCSLARRCAAHGDEQAGLFQQLAS